MIDTSLNCVVLVFSKFVSIQEKMLFEIGGGVMEELVERAKEGSKEDFVLLIEKHKQSMYKVARSYLSHEEDVADVLQESILKCYVSLPKLRENRYFKTWLIRIVINECKKILMQKKNEVCLEEFTETEVKKCGYDKLEFQSLMDSMEEKYRTILLLYYGEGYNTREIAQIMGLNAVTVRSRLSRARKKYLQLYEKKGNEVVSYDRG